MLQRRWVFGHVLAAVMAGLFIALGIWQLARHHEKQDLVKEAKTAYAAPAPPLRTPPQSSGTRVEATGAYDASHEILLRDQSRGDAVGVDVLTPLVLADGSAVLVNRGLVPAGSPTTGPTLAPAPAPPVVVRGVVRASRTLSPLDAVRDIGGHVSVPRVDITRLGTGLPYPLRPVWIEAQYQQPSPGADDPALPAPPAPDQVNHLQYSIEWFALALIPIIGWPIALAHYHRKRRSTPTA